MDDALLIDDTIAALASAPGSAARGIVRISGAEVHRLLSDVFVPQDASLWSSLRRSRRHRGQVRLPDLHLPLEVDLLYWPTTRSYTGQPLAELHTVGSPPLLEAILSLLFNKGARPARRGEFTLRAFLAGRIDLMQAEAVLGTIDATDQQELNVALQQLAGGLSGRIADLHEELLLHLADLEAGLDFVEEDIEFVNRETLLSQLEEGMTFLSALMDQSQRRMQSTGLRRVVLAGLPNAGKSTLFNALLDEQRAIVSNIAGTTRDYLAATTQWDGLSIELIDTAGWEDALTGIERFADEQRSRQWERADLVLWCTAADATAAESARDARQQEAAGSVVVDLLPVITKGDCVEHDPAASIVVSATTGGGLNELRQNIAARLQSVERSETLLGSTAARCRDSLGAAHQALSRAHEAAAAGLGEELIAVELREAIDDLGKIAGRVYTDDVLDRIFSRFCIGK